MVYMFLAEGFEEVEALCPLDLLRRAGVNIITVGVGSKNICGAHGIRVEADVRDKEFVYEKADMIILPGGMPGTFNLYTSPAVHEAIEKTVNCDGYIAAICAAPSILGMLGLLDGKEATCYPGFEEKLKGAVISYKKVVRDGKIITAAGMGVALEFGLELVKVLCGEAVSEKLRKAVIAD